jgi:hypothetical protein
MPIFWINLKYAHQQIDELEQYGCIIRFQNLRNEKISTDNDFDLSTHLSKMIISKKDKNKIENKIKLLILKYFDSLSIF